MYRLLLLSMLDHDAQQEERYMANREGGRRSGMNLLHHLRELIRQGNQEAFAQELNLDPSLTRT